MKSAASRRPKFRLDHSAYRGVRQQYSDAMAGAAKDPSVRFSVESGDKKKEGVSQQLCLAGQKGDTPCHLRAAD
jgi:hypothetical protein